MDEFLKKLAKILELEKVNASDRLKDFTLLDSLGQLTLIAMLDADYKVSITTADLTQLDTAEDLWRIVQCLKCH